MRLLLLLLHGRRSVLLKGRIRDLQAHQGAQTNVQNNNENKSGDKPHEDTYDQLEYPVCT